MSNLSNVMRSLRPTAKWTIKNESEVIWQDDTQQQPTEAEVLAEVARLESEWNATEYQRLRAAEYPPIANYLDGVVKGDQEQIDKYIADCLAVKAKYPKEQA